MTAATEQKEFKISKEHCKGLVNGVCSGCGRELVPIETVDNSGNPTYWPGCEECNCFDYGVKPLAFEIAKTMVTKHHHVQYSHMDSPYNKDEAYKKYWLSSQIGGTSKMVSFILSLADELSKDKSDNK